MSGKSDSSHYVRSPGAALRVWTGSMTTTANDTSVLMWTNSEFGQLFGPYMGESTFIGVTNGDGNATGVHVDGVTYVPGEGIFAVFDNVFNGRLRINWLVVN